VIRVNGSESGYDTWGFGKVLWLVFGVQVVGLRESAKTVKTRPQYASRLGFRVLRLGVRQKGIRCRVRALGVRVQGFGSRDEGYGNIVQDF